MVFDPAGRVLLIRRGQPPNAGLWSVPGGRLEPGETLTECCRREVREETGLDIEPGSIVAVTDREAEGFHYIIIDFVATLKTPAVPEPVPATDVSAARWVSPAELAAYALVEGLESVLRTARSGSAMGLRSQDGDGRLFLPWPPDDG